MRKELMMGFVFILFGFSFVLAVVPPASACGDPGDDQLIMRLSDDSNAHVSAWNTNVATYTTEICYNDVFGFDYVGADPHDCLADDTNRILSLSAFSNAHASKDYDAVNYKENVCYGDLICTARGSAAVPGACILGEQLVATLSDDSNAHVSDASADTYGVKICCGAAGVFWADMNGDEIDEAWFGQTVQMIARGIGGGSFEIMEDDSLGMHLPIDSDIRVGSLAIPGENIGSQRIGLWTISNDDIFATGEGPDDYEDFYFEIAGKFSKGLEVHPEGKDELMNVTLVSPECGKYYNESEVLEIIVDADDPDSAISGTISFDGWSVSFSNGVHTFHRTLDNPGSLQLVVEASSSGGDRSRITSNIMVLDLKGGNYVEGDYIAACILSPKDFSAVDSSSVAIDASTTSGIIINASGLYELEPGIDPFSWYWNFYDPNGVEYPDSEYIMLNSVDSLAYDFFKEFPVAGDNSATLSVEI